MITILGYLEMPYWLLMGVIISFLIAIYYSFKYYANNGYYEEIISWMSLVAFIYILIVFGVAIYVIN